MGNSVTHSDWDAQRERLSAYLDGELPATERAALDAHLRDCAQCQRELAALRQTRALLRALPAPAAPRDFRLPAQPAIATTGRRGPPAWARPMQALGTIAAMIGLAFLIATALPQLPRPMAGGMAGGAETSAGTHQTVYGPVNGTPIPSLTASSITATASADQSSGQLTPQASATGTPGNTLEHAPTAAPTSAPAGSSSGSSSGSSAGSNSHYSPETSAPASPPTPFPIVPVAGFTLLFGGGAAVAVGSLARRRARADEPDPRDAELEDDE